MNELELLSSEFSQELSLKLAPELRAGFPSPAEEYLQESLDFNRDLVKHPHATFYARVVGDSMIDAGIKEGDIAVIDRSLEPHDGSIIVAYINNEFTIKYLDLSHKSDGYIELRPGNPRYQPIRVNEGDAFEVWGVLSFVIHKF